MLSSALTRNVTLWLTSTSPSATRCFPPLNPRPRCAGPRGPAAPGRARRRLCPFPGREFLPRAARRGICKNAPPRLNQVAGPSVPGYEITFVRKRRQDVDTKWLAAAGLAAATLVVTACGSSAATGTATSSGRLAARVHGLPGRAVQAGADDGAQPGRDRVRGTLLPGCSSCPYRAPGHIAHSCRIAVAGRARRVQSCPRKVLPDPDGPVAFAVLGGRLKPSPATLSW